MAPIHAGWDCEIRGAAMRLQSVSPQNHRDLIQCQPIERLAALDRGENVPGHLRYNQIFDEKDFLKLERRAEPRCRAAIRSRAPARDKNANNQTGLAPTFPSGN